MKNYHHLLVLVRNKGDGLPLLEHACKIAANDQAILTLGHFAIDYRAMNYVSDCLMNDAAASELIQAKSLLSELAHNSDWPVATTLLFSQDRIAELRRFISHNGVDLVICGHKNRVFGLLTSRSMTFVNHTDVDFLIKHIQV